RAAHTVAEGEGEAGSLDAVSQQQQNDEREQADHLETAQHDDLGAPRYFKGPPSEGSVRERTIVIPRGQMCQRVLCKHLQMFGGRSSSRVTAGLRVLVVLDEDLTGA